MKTELPMLEQRRIEASVVKPIYEELVAEFDEAKAQEIIGRAIIANARAQGRAYAEAEGRPTSLQTFAETMPQWTAGGALEIDPGEQDEARLHFNVTRCRYAEMYREMGLGGIGHLLSCNRDGTFCEGYDPKIRLKRSQTIMGGASHCDFRFSYAADAADPEADGGEGT